MRISDCSSDVCSSDLAAGDGLHRMRREHGDGAVRDRADLVPGLVAAAQAAAERMAGILDDRHAREGVGEGGRSEEHTSELQSLMRISYAVFCLKKKKNQLINNHK